MSADFTARITEELRALPSPIGAEPFTENDDGAPMWLSCLPWELLLCKIAKIAAAAAEEHYRPRIETVEQLDALLGGSVVRDASRYVHEKRITGGRRWRQAGREGERWSDEIDLPVVVLWSPGGER